MTPEDVNKIIKRQLKELNEDIMLQNLDIRLDTYDDYHLMVLKAAIQKVQLRREMKR